MKYIYACTCVLFIFSGFHSITQSIQITGIRVKSTIPIPTKNGNYIRITSHDIYHADNLTLYRISVGFDSSINGVSVLQEDRFQYFVFSTDSLYGLNFSTVVRKQLTVSRQCIDSIKSQFHNKAGDRVSSLRPVPDSIFTIPGGELVRAFQVKKTAKYPENFTYYFYYSKKFNRFTETLWTPYDTSNGFKLFKVGILGHGTYYKKYTFQMPPRTYVFEFEEVSPEDIRTAAIYFDKYKDYYKKK